MTTYYPTSLDKHLHNMLWLLYQFPNNIGTIVYIATILYQYMQYLKFKIDNKITPHFFRGVHVR